MPQWALIDRMLTIAPPCAALAHRADRRLHQEEGRAGVDGEEPRPVVEVGVEEGGAVGQAGGVDQGVDPAEAVEAGRDQPGGRLGSARSAATKAVGVPAPASSRRDRLAAGGVAAGEQQAGGAGARRAPRRSARPTPCVAPVTSATLPSTRASTSLSLERSFYFASMERGFPAVNRDARFPPPCVFRATVARPSSTVERGERGG